MNFYAVDVETNGLYYWKHTIFGVSECYKNNATFLSWDDNKIKAMRALFAQDDIDFVFHNAKFDLHMLQQYGINPPKNIHDTAIMAHLINENKRAHLQNVAVRYLDVEKWKDIVKDYIKKHKCTYDQVPADVMGNYSALDAKYTWQLAGMLYPMIIQEGLLDLYNQEIELTRCLIDIEARGVLINVDLLTSVRQTLVEEEQEYSDKIYELAGRKFDILSEKQLGEVLFTELRLPEQGISQKSKLLKVNDEALSKIEHPIIGPIKQYRHAQKMRSTYCDNIYEHLDSDNALHCCYHQYGTVTGRMSCREPNLQNVPRGSRIRELFIPRPGYRFVFNDYSQQEMRLYTGYANDTKMLGVFDRGEDIYCYMANIYYKTTGIVKKDPRRDFCKTLSLAILYGIGISGISKKYRVSKEEAARIRNHFHDSFPKMRKFLYYISDKIKTNGYIMNPWGRKRRLNKDNAYKGMNSLIQGSGGDIIKEKTIQIHHKLKETKSGILLLIHDDIGNEVHESEQHLIPIVKEIMEDVPKVTVELPVEVSQSTTNWGDKK